MAAFSSSCPQYLPFPEDPFLLSPPNSINTTFKLTAFSLGDQQQQQQQPTATAGMNSLCPSGVSNNALGQMPVDKGIDGISPQTENSAAKQQSNTTVSSSAVLDKIDGGYQLNQGPASMTVNVRRRKTTHGSSLGSDQSKDEGEGGKGKRQKKKKKASEEEKKKGEDKEEEKKGSEEPRRDYIHVRARRGQATDSHSLAERLRREKISERMRILQKLVPGCDKVTGKALMLDEIINYVQSLQNQVEFLSMKLASLSPVFYEFGVDLDAFIVKPQDNINENGLMNVEEQRHNFFLNRTGFTTNSSLCSFN